MVFLFFQFLFWQRWCLLQWTLGNNSTTIILFNWCVNLWKKEAMVELWSEPANSWGWEKNQYFLLGWLHPLVLEGFLIESYIVIWVIYNDLDCILSSVCELSIFTDSFLHLMKSYSYKIDWFCHGLSFIQYSYIFFCATSSKFRMQNVSVIFCPNLSREYPN